jgi:hypothetical protein
MTKSRQQRDNDASKPKCPTCGLYRFDAPRCPGHGPSGGGGEDKASGNDSASASALGATSPSGKVHSPAPGVVLKDDQKALLLQMAMTSNLQSVLDKLVIDLRAIGLLIDFGKDKDGRETGVLTIKGVPSLSSELKEKLKNLIDVIETNFDKFIAANNMTSATKDRKELSLTLSIPNASLYDKFILQLIPVLTMGTLRKKDEDPIEQGTSKKSKTPLSMELKKDK